MAPGTLLVEIWSDVVCPFCYIGKRRFEKALAQFEHRDEVEIVWKSFQLHPKARTDPTVSINEYLARLKGIDVEAARALHERVTQMAKAEGLDYDFDRVVVANTFDAHRMVHFARQQGKQGEAEERLFRAYFIEGRNIGDRAVLADLGEEIALDRGALAAALERGDFADAVESDIYEARQIGINGVPFHLLDGRLAVSGAQDPATFLGALRRGYEEGRLSLERVPPAV